MRSALVALALVSLSAVPARSLTKIFVHETATGGGNDTSCNFTGTPGYGNSPTNPLKTHPTTLVSGLRQAITCANLTTAVIGGVHNDDVEIVVICTSPDTSGADQGFCVHGYSSAPAADLDATYPGTSGLTKGRLVRSEPPWANKIKPTNNRSFKITGERA